MSAASETVPDTVRIVDALLGARGIAAKEAISRALAGDMLRDVEAELNTRMHNLQGSARSKLEWHIDVLNRAGKAQTAEERDHQLEEGRRYQLLPVDEGHTAVFELMRMARNEGEVCRRYNDHVFADIGTTLEALLLVATAPPTTRPRRVQMFETLLAKLHPTGMPAMRASSLVAKLPECIYFSAADWAAYVAAVGDRLAAAGWPEASSFCHLALARQYAKQPAQSLAMLARAREIAPVLRDRFSFLQLQIFLSLFLPPSPPQLALLMGAVSGLEKQIEREKGKAPAWWQSSLAYANLLLALSVVAKSGMPPRKFLGAANKIHKRLLKEGGHPDMAQLRREATIVRLLQAVLLIPGAAKSLPFFYAMVAAAGGSNRQSPMDPAAMEAVTERFERWSGGAADMMESANSERKPPRPSAELTAELALLHADAKRILQEPESSSATGDVDGEIDASVMGVFNANNKVALLIGEGKKKEAVEVAERAISAWRRAYFTALTIDEARAVAQAGQTLPALAARLRLETRDAGEVLQMFAAESGMMASDVTGEAARLLSEAQPSRAAEILSLRQEIVRERARVSVSFSEEKLARSYDALSGLIERWNEIWNAAGDLPTADLGEYARAAPVGGVIVTLATTPTGSTVFILKPDASVERLDLPKLTTFHAEEMARKFLLAEINYSLGLRERRSMAAADFDDALAASARECWTELVGHLEDKLVGMGVDPEAPLTFVGMGHMEQLPLQAAWRPAGDGREYLLQKRVLRFAPSFGALLSMWRRKEARPGAAGDVLGFFVPDVWAKEVDLKGSIKVELPRLQEIYGERMKPFVSLAGSRKSFLEALEGLATSATRVDLHLSLHGDFNGVMPEFSAIKLAPLFLQSGDVTVLDLLALPPSYVLDSVCMACCRTGKRDLLGQGYEGIGLIEAFLGLGASSVLSSLYPIIDDATAEMVPAMYEERRKGADLAEALTSVVRARMDRRDVPPPPLINWAAFRATCA